MPMTALSFILLAGIKTFNKKSDKITGPNKGCLIFAYYLTEILTDVTNCLITVFVATHVINNGPACMVPGNDVSSCRKLC